MLSASTLLFLELGLAEFSTHTRQGRSHKLPKNTCTTYTCWHKKLNSRAFYSSLFPHFLQTLTLSPKLSFLIYALLLIKEQAISAMPCIAQHPLAPSHHAHFDSMQCFRSEPALSRGQNANSLISFMSILLLLTFFTFSAWYFYIR